MTDKTKMRLKGAALALALTWMAALTIGTCAPQEHEFQSGGGTVLSGGGGLSKVTNAAGILSGSGTVANPETATLTVGSGLGGTGSNGSAIHTALNVGSGLGGTGSSSPLTTSLNVGSGLNGTGSSSPLTTSLNVGSGLGGNGSSTPITTSLNVGSGLNGTGSSSPLTVNVTTATCTNGRGVTAIGATGTGTCGNVGHNAYGGTHFEWSSDWMWLSAANTINSQINVGDYSLICAGSGAQIQNASGVTARPGVLEMTTGAASATGQCRAMSNPTVVNFGDGNWQWQSVVAWGSISTAADEVEDVIGFIDTTTVNQVDGCYFVYDRGNVLTAPGTGAGNTGNKQDLECWCANGSTRTGYVMDGTITSDASFTTVAAPVAAVTYPNTNVANLQIIMTGSSEADFYYNGVLSCKITTNIPTGSSHLTGFGFNHIKSANTAAARTLDIEYTNVIVDLTSARSP